MKIINIRIFYWQQMSNTLSNMVTPLGTLLLRTTHMSTLMQLFSPQMFRSNLGHTEGELRPVFILVTTRALYVLTSSSGVSNFHKEAVVTYAELDYISVSCDTVLPNFIFIFPSLLLQWMYIPCEGLFRTVFAVLLTLQGIISWKSTKFIVRLWIDVHAGASMVSTKIMAVKVHESSLTCVTYTCIHPHTHTPWHIVYIMYINTIKDLICFYYALCNKSTCDYVASWA